METTSGRTARVLCCKCGVPIIPNEANTCVTCLSQDVDITKDVERQNTIVFCPKCERYLNPPSKWVAVNPESPELLSMCIKRVRGLNKGLAVREAKFLWTEPHSKRINIEITVRGELPTGDMVEQAIPLEFVVHSQQCLDCARSAAKDYWNACVQVRQRTEHKRTLLHLEQIMLHSNAHKECNSLKQVTGGMDFFFGTRSQAVSFVNFLCKHAPCRYQTSQHLKSHDVHNNTYNYKFTFSVEVAAVCKNDIVCLSKSQSQHLGGIGPLCVVTKVSESVHLIDPITCQVCQVDGTSYFASPFTAIATQKQLTAFVVVEIEEDGTECGQTGSNLTRKSKPAARLSNRHRAISLWLMYLNPNGTRTAADSQQDGMIHTRSHLGRLLQVGDTVYGLDVRNCNINHSEFEKLPEHQVPDVILVYRPPQPTDEDLSVGSSRPASKARKRRRQQSETATSELLSTATADTDPTVLDDAFDPDDFEFEDMDGIEEPDEGLGE